MILRDLPDDVVSGLGGAVVPTNLCALAKGQVESVSKEFFLESFTVLGRDRGPHVGDENNVLQRRVTTEFTVHLEIPSGDSGKPSVGDAVDVDDPSKLGPFSVSVRKFSPEDREATNADIRLHDG